MHSFENDPSYLSLFLDEASEQLASLETGILHLESSPDDETLQEIFRSAHSLKGASRAMGFAAMADLTHAMEDLFDLLRSGSIPVSTELIDALFAAVDLLEQSREMIATDGSSTLDMSAATDRIWALSSNPSGDSTTSAAQGPTSSKSFQHGIPGESVRLAVHEAFDCGLKVYKVVTTIARDCAMRSVRAMLVMEIFMLPFCVKIVMNMLGMI